MGENPRIVVGITGSSGVIYGIMLLKALEKFEIETHLVLSKWGEKNIEIEKVQEYLAKVSQELYLHKKRQRWIREQINPKKLEVSLPKEYLPLIKNISKQLEGFQ